MRNSLSVAAPNNKTFKRLILTAVLVLLAAPHPRSGTRSGIVVQRLSRKLMANVWRPAKRRRN